MPKLMVPERFGESQEGREIVEEANRRLREGGLTRSSSTRSSEDEKKDDEKKS